MLRFALAVPMIVHGLAHLAGFVAAWTPAQTGFTDNPWIISAGVTLKNPLGRVFGLLWTLAVLGLVGAGLGIVFSQAWWPGLAIAGAAVSLLVILPWWNTVVPGAKVGALFDLLTLAALLLPWSSRLINLFP